MTAEFNIRARAERGWLSCGRNPGAALAVGVVVTENSPVLKAGSTSSGRALSILAAAAIVVGGVAVLAAQVRPPRRNPRPPQPARPVDLDRYLGLWHEFGRYQAWFERGCDAVTAEYRAGEDGLIEVINTCGARTSGRRPKIARGRARVVAGSDGARLKVSFFGPLFIGDYWVLDHGEDYDWSIVGEPSGRFLWILTRRAHPGQALGRALIARAEAMGYEMSDFRLTTHA